MGSPLDFVLGLLRDYLQAEPARVIAYGVLAALTAANLVGHALGYTDLPDGVANGITLLVTALITEAIRRFVYSPSTVGQIVEDLAPESASPETPTP